MSALFAYALVAGAPRGLKVRGVGGAPLRLARLAGFTVAVGPLPQDPSPTLESLAVYDRAVKRLFRHCRAVLPLRYGTVVEDRAELGRLLARRKAALSRALREVEGRAQFALRVLGPAPAAIEAPLPASGAAFLRARARAQRVWELDQAVAAVEPFVRAQRAERGAQGPFAGAIFHLVDRPHARGYLRAVKRLPPLPSPQRLLISGPGPAWAFAPEVGR